MATPRTRVHDATSRNLRCSIATALAPVRCAQLEIAPLRGLAMMSILGRRAGTWLECPIPRTSRCSRSRMAQPKFPCSTRISTGSLITGGSRRTLADRSRTSGSRRCSRFPLQPSVNWNDAPEKRSPSRSTGSRPSDDRLVFPIVQASTSLGHPKRSTGWCHLAARERDRTRLELLTRHFTSYLGWTLEFMRRMGRIAPTGPPRSEESA